MFKRHGAERSGKRFTHSTAVGVGMLPMAALFKTITIIPEIVAKVAGAVGVPMSARELGGVAIDAVHPVGSPKIILLTSNGQVISDIRPQKNINNDE